MIMCRKCFERPAVKNRRKCAACVKVPGPAPLIPKRPENLVDTGIRIDDESRIMTLPDGREVPAPTVFSSGPGKFWYRPGGVNKNHHAILRVFKEVS